MSGSPPEALSDGFELTSARMLQLFPCRAAAEEELEGDYEFEPRGNVEVKGLG